MIDNIKGEHNHDVDILRPYVKAKENSIISAAAVVGNPAPERVLEEIKMNIDASSVPGAAGCMRKRKALAMALHREKKRISGEINSNSIPKTAKEIKVIFSITIR